MRAACFTILIIINLVTLIILERCKLWVFFWHPFCHFKWLRSNTYPSQYPGHEHLQFMDLLKSGRPNFTTIQNSRQNHAFLIFYSLFFILRSIARIQFALNFSTIKLDLFESCFYRTHLKTVYIYWVSQVDLRFDFLNKCSRLMSSSIWWTKQCLVTSTNSEFFIIKQHDSAWVRK
jgi:hypothetical protein